MIFLLLGIKPKEGGHLPWGIPSDTVVHVSPSTTPNQSLRNLEQTLHFTVDGQIVEHQKKKEDPIILTPAQNFPGMSLDAHHVLHPFLVDNGGEKFRLKSLAEVLESHEEVDTRFLDDQYANLDHSTLSLLHSTVSDELNEFFDTPSSHPVHSTRYRYQPGMPLEDSYVTADESF